VEKAGTDRVLSDYDIARLDRFERELEQRQKEAHEMSVAMTSLRTDFDAFRDSVLTAVTDLSSKLDTARTRKTDWGLLVSALTLVGALGFAFLSPIQDKVDGLGRAMEFVERTRWTREDHDRTIDRLTADIESDLDDIREHQKEQDERIRELELGR